MKNCRQIRKTALVLVLTLAISVFFSPMSLAAGASDFSDVSTDKWYYESISYVVSKGLFQGTGSTTFSPNKDMTRAMFVTVLGRLAGADADSWCAANIQGSGVNFRSGPGTGYNVIGSFSGGESVTITGRSGDWYAIRYGSKTGYVKNSYVSPKYKNFSDVSYGQYYTGYVIWAYEKGYVSGTGTNTFSPNSSITREQICKILSAFASGKGYSIPATQSAVSFSDASSIHSWASEAVRQMQTGGIVNGYSNGTFCPTRCASRAEVAKMLTAFIQTTGATVGVSSDADKGSSSSAGSGSGTSTGSGGSSSTAAVLSSDTVSIVSNRVRVALYASTKYDFHSQVSSVKLYNYYGDSFAYGSMNADRSFSSEGTVNADTIVVTTDGSTYTIADTSGNILATRSGTSLALRPIGTSQKAQTRVNDGYYYYGDFNCLNAYENSRQITLVNYVDMDDYVKGVLPYEFPLSWPAETLKAGAVAVRSYAMAYMKSSAYTGFGFDLVSSTSCQVYSGRKNYSDSYLAASDAAVEATSNMYLTYNGAVCFCMYSSSNGGSTKASPYYAYMTAKTDPYDAEAGKGYSGHGYGMSQWGAYIMGKNYGLNYLDILGFYYTGTAVKYGA